MEKEELEMLKKGYKHLGWQLNALNSEENKKCLKLKHKMKVISYNRRGSHDLYWCDECRIFLNIDCSD